MKVIRKYQSVYLSKRQAEFMQFIETGSNNFWEAYFQCHRKDRIDRHIRFYASWFNRTLKQIQMKGILQDIPYVYIVGKNWIWANPGVKSSKANFQALTLQPDSMNTRSEINRII